jgi:hypothetical protein
MISAALPITYYGWASKYIAKSNPYIVMVSTPNAPDGLFERIEKESEDTCLYKRIFLDYTCALVRYTKRSRNRKDKTITFV